jgi:methylglutaconyl-CoA hydratase
LFLYQVEPGIARITLNRPDKRNALNAELISELKKAVQSSDRLIVLTGAGNDFCSGADLSGLHNMAEANVLDHMASAREMAELFIAMRRYPHPIIAAVRGRALAGGCGLATACDIILASESAQFGYPEVNIGFVPAMVMAILRRSVSEKRAFDLITTGDVNRVFAAETFDVDVQAFASKMASKSTSALMLSKQLLYHIDTMGFEAAIEAGVQTNAIARSTDDCKRGIERFLKKRPSA